MDGNGIEFRPDFPIEINCANQVRRFEIPVDFAQDIEWLDTLDPGFEECKVRDASGREVTVFLWDTNLYLFHLRDGSGTPDIFEGSNSHNRYLLEVSQASGVTRAIRSTAFTSKC